MTECLSTKGVTHGRWLATRLILFTTVVRTELCHSALKVSQKSAILKGSNQSFQFKKNLIKSVGIILNSEEKEFQKKTAHIGVHKQRQYFFLQISDAKKFHEIDLFLYFTKKSS